MANPDQARDEEGKWTAIGAAARAAAGVPSDFVQQAKLASDLHGNVPTRNGKPVPVQTKTAYHVTTRENAEKILQEGFKLEKVKPRWTNDYAVSLSPTSIEKAAEYMADKDSWSKKGLVMLAVTVKGRAFKESDDLDFYAISPQSYTRSVLKAGWDASNDFTFVYNPKAIVKISIVPDDEIWSK